MVVLWFKSVQRKYLINKEFSGVRRGDFYPLVVLIEIFFASKTQYWQGFEWGKIFFYKKKLALLGEMKYRCTFAARNFSRRELC
jgi:hypothetical protein